MKLVHISEGARFFARSLRTRLKGFRKYGGNAEQICSKVVAGCYNGSYFQTSRGHFCQFYTRDFGWCIDSLLKLGYKKQVMETLEYALSIFSKSKRITASITPSGKPFDFPSYAPDSLAYLIMSLRAANAKALVQKHKSLLNNGIKGYFDNVIEHDTGLVRSDKSFSSMKDHAVRKSSCYNNIMTAMLAEELKKFRFLENPFKEYNFKKIIKDMFWNGEYFLDDLSGASYVAGDANVFPYWAGVFNSKKMLKSSIQEVKKAGLDKPFPLRYTNSPKLGKREFIADFFAKNYEGNTAWMHMGPLYISLVKKVDKKDFNKYCTQYKKLIEKHHNYIELFNPDGTPFRTPFYYADESMLWAANFLTL